MSDTKELKELKMNFAEIEIEKIKENPKNIRLDTEDLSELMSSILEKGLLQPIGIQQLNGEYIIIYGHRRFKAMKKLGYRKIPANIYFTLSPTDMLILNTIENIHQKTITPLELGKIVSELINLKFSLKEIAVKLSVSLAKIRNSYEAFIHLPEKYIKDSAFGERGKRTTIPISTLNFVSRLSRSYKLTKPEIYKIMDICKQSDISQRQVQSIPYLLKTQNLTMEKAVKKSLEFDFLDVVIGIEKNKLNELMKLQNKSRTEIAYLIMARKIKVSNDKIIIRPSQRGR